MVRWILSQSWHFDWATDDAGESLVSAVSSFFIRAQSESAGHAGRSLLLPGCSIDRIFQAFNIAQHQAIGSWPRKDHPAIGNHRLRVDFKQSLFCFRRTVRRSIDALNIQLQADLVKKRLKAASHKWRNFAVRLRETLRAYLVD